MSFDTNDAVIEAVARRLYASDGLVPLWDGQSDRVRELYLNNARALAEVGLLVDELPAEPLPDGQVRSRDGRVIVRKSSCSSAYPWKSALTGMRYRDDEVRDWPILVPEADLDDLRADHERITGKLASVAEHRDILLDTCRDYEARIAGLEAAEGCAVDADALEEVIVQARLDWLGDEDDARTFDQVAIAAIRKRLPAARRPALPAGHAAVDMRDIDADSLQYVARTGDKPGRGVLALIAGRAAHAELARRAAEGETR